jgi:hypothetical protein
MATIIPAQRDGTDAAWNVLNNQLIASKDERNEGSP